MLVSVIICTYATSRINDLLEAIESLLDQTYKEIEIIVVVDHNRELYEKLSLVLGEKVRLIHNREVRGLSGSRNLGIERAKGEIIAFLDDDAVAAEDWIEQLLVPFEDDKVAAVGGLTLPLWEGKRPRWLPAEFLWVLGCTYQGHINKIGRVRNVFGGNSCFRSSCFKELGKFMPAIGRIGNKMLTGEETEYCMRVWQKLPHMQILFNPDAVIFHKVPRQRTKLKYFIRRTFGSGYSLAFIHHLRKNFGKKTEKGFLYHLATSFIPRKVKLLPKDFIAATGQLTVAFLGVFCTGLGYLIGSFQVRFKEV
jgi:glycosyltransferase involved in cell wall biosynthesis